MHERCPTPIGAFPIQFYTWFLYFSSIQIKPDLTNLYSSHTHTHIPLVWKATVILWHHHPSAPYLNIPESIWLQLLIHDARQGEGLSAVLEVLGCWCHLRSLGCPFSFRVGAVLLLAMTWAALVTYLVWLCNVNCKWVFLGLIDN